MLPRTLLVVALAYAPAAAAKSPVDESGSPSKSTLKRIKQIYGCDADASHFETIDSSVSKATVTVETATWKVDLCGTEQFLTVSYGGKVWRFWTDAALRKKAPFDLDCDAKAITYTFIDATNVGVEGCGKRVTYIGTTSGWVANVKSDASE